MMVRDEARRGQLIYGRMSVEEPGRRRDTGVRRDGHDDLGRTVMPFDLFVSVQRRAPLFDRNVMELMELAFGGR